MFVVLWRVRLFGLYWLLVVRVFFPFVLFLFD